MDFSDLASVPEAAALVRVSIPTVRMWLSKGKLPRIKVGSRTLVSKAALATLLHVQPVRGEDAAA